MSRPAGVILKRSRYVRFRAVAGLAVILLIGFAVRYSGETLVMSRHVDRPNVIVVLASHEWERLPTAAQLARQNAAAQVLLTLPVHVTFPHFGPSVYLVSELTAEERAPSVELEFRRTVN